MHDVRMGSFGPQVRVLQRLIGLRADADFGPETEAKVKKWQRAQGLTASGVCDGETWASIGAALPGLASGCRGRFVQAAQELVGAKPDGVFGPDTVAAVRAWQKRAGLSQTGMIAAEDWQALLGTPEEAMEDLPDAVWIPGTQPVDYKQTDPRWKDRPYTVTGDPEQTIGTSGCGPTRRRARIFDSAVGGRPQADLRNHKVPQPCMAGIVATWFDERVTPVKMCVLAVKWGCRTENSGTSRAFFKTCAEHWPFSGYTGTTSFSTARKALEEGMLVIANMGPGYWTKGGHYICCYQHADGRIWANDPASAVRCSQEDSAFAAQAKYFAIFKR